MTLTVAANKATAICVKLNIPLGKIGEVKINRRAKKRWGCCKRVGDAPFTIEVNECLCDGKHDEALLNTLLHEYIHTVKGCQNHGAEWKRWASVVSENTPYDISRTKSYEEMGFKPDTVKAKYRLKCVNCGKIINRNRMSDFVRHPNRYTHKECGGSGWIRL